MRKQITALFLAGVLLFHTQAEIALAANAAERAPEIGFEKESADPIVDQALRAEGEEAEEPKTENKKPEKPIPQNQGTAKENGDAQSPTRDFGSVADSAETATESLGNSEEEGKEESEKTYHTLTFYLEGGSLPSGEKNYSIQIAENTIPDPAAISAVAPVKKGYLFQGWKDENGKRYTFTCPILSDLILRASWKPISYQVRFHPNGGKGKAASQAFIYGKKKKLAQTHFSQKGYTFAGWNTKKNGKGTTYKNRQAVANLSAENNAQITLYAIWKGVPYKIRYKGNGATSGKMKASIYRYGVKGRLLANKFKKKGYRFVKWTTKQNGKGKAYKNKAAIKNLTSKKKHVITLYAQWKKATYTIKYHTNGGKFTTSPKKKYRIDSRSFRLPAPARKGYDFDGWYTDKKWKHRRSKVKHGSAKNLTLYAKWVKCTRKPRPDAATIDKCQATRRNTVRIKATVHNRIASADDYYYLVYVDPIHKKSGRMAARAFKGKQLSFRLDTAKNQGYVTSMFGIAVKKDGRYHLISAPSFVRNPQKAASNQQHYQAGKTKKGIQLYHGVSELDDCSVKQYFDNLTVSTICANGTVPYKYNGVTYYFNELAHLQNVARECSRRHVTLTVEILLDRNDWEIDLINPKARSSRAPFYSWNIYQKRPREKMEAIFCYLGKVFSQKDCYVSNWILGNEVNCPEDWNGAGGMSKEEYFETYAYAFRALYYGIKSQYASAHIFICTDNHWNTASSRSYSARQTVMDFHDSLNRIQSGLRWNLAYHAYSNPLTDTRFWTGSGTNWNVWTTPAITMHNIQLLTDFIRSQYGSSVRIILSEQGFSSVPGQSVQAAALAYAYYIAACNPMIDAFIIRAYDDHPLEIAMGLRMGIVGKESFQVFKYMDSPQSLQYTSRYLSTIGASSWPQIVPGYQEERIWTMYRN